MPKFTISMQNDIPLRLLFILVYVIIAVKSSDPAFNSLPLRAFLYFAFLVVPRTNAKGPVDFYLHGLPGNHLPAYHVDNFI